MAGKNFIYDFFRKNMGGRNVIELPQKLFDSITIPEDLLYVEPFDISSRVKVGSFEVVLINVPLIVGTVLEDKLGFKKGEKIIYNKDYVSFVYYQCLDTNRIRLGIPTHSILGKSI